MKQKDFEWPDVATEIERIKRNSQLYKDLDIREAFQKAYGIKIKKSRKKDANLMYHDVQPGEIIPLKITHIDKKTVTFDQSLFKENLVSAVNLYQYKRFKKNTPKETINCKVISKTADKIVVDPLAPMFDEWLKDKLDNIKNQYHLSEDRSIIVENLNLIRGGFSGDIRVDTVSDFCGQDIMLKAFIPGSQIVLNIESDFERWNGKSVRAFITNYIVSSSNFGPASDKMSLICSAKEYLKFIGDKVKMDFFNEYCLESERWNKIINTSWKGVVTGIINSSKKQGVFVEIPTLCITGMVEMPSAKLNYFHPGMEVEVKLDRIDEPVVWNQDVGQMQHKPAFVIEDDVLKKCNLRFVFSLVEK